jgi:RHS repeat-associated protein
MGKMDSGHKWNGIGKVAPSSPVQGVDDSSRFRYVTEGYSTWLPDGAPQGHSSGEATMAERKYVGISATLWANGEAVAVNRLGNAEIRGGASYLGKDVLGSVRSRSNENGQLEDRYEYDAFGKPYKGDLNSGMNLGYTGKPYDTTTGMYNYGYRDYQPEVARFTTVDPIRDGANWFAYVNNDPVNYVDLWGLNSALLTDKGSVLGAGHSAHAVQNYDESGAPTNWTVYEVGRTTGEHFSSNPLDPIQAVLAGSAGGSSIGSTSGSGSGTVAGSATAAGGGTAAALVSVGVNTYQVDDLNELSRFDRVTEFNTTRAEDDAIRNASVQLGQNFGNYNVLTNNCSQYSAASLAAGGLNTTQNPVPNVAHNYADKNNEERIAYTCSK